MINPDMNAFECSNREIWDLHECEYDSLASFIQSKVESFEWEMDDGNAQDVGHLTIILDGKKVDYAVRIINDVRIAISKDDYSCGRYVIHAGDCWFIFDGELSGLRQIGNGGVPSPLLDQEETLSFLDLVPQQILMVKDCDPPPVLVRNNLKPKDVIFFPADFPRGSPISLSETFVLTFCHQKYDGDLRSNERAPFEIRNEGCDDGEVRKYIINTPWITLDVAALVECFADHYPTCKCYANTDDFWKAYGKIEERITDCEYITFLRVLRELGIKWYR